MCRSATFYHVCISPFCLTCDVPSPVYLRFLPFDHPSIHITHYTYHTLSQAAADNNPALVKRLLEQGADINFQDRVYLPSGEFTTHSPITRAVAQGAVGE